MYIEQLFIISITNPIYQSMYNFYSSVIFFKIALFKYFIFINKDDMYLVLFKIFPLTFERL